MFYLDCPSDNLFSYVVKADEVRRLIDEEGVPPTHGNIVGQTALHISSLWGSGKSISIALLSKLRLVLIHVSSVETLHVLIEKGADVNAQNRIAGMTPLHCAIRGTFQSFHETHRNRLECVKLLIEAGADPSICDTKGNDAAGCIDDLVKEAAMRGLGNIDAEANKMREVVFGEKSNLLICVEDMNIDGVKDCLGGEIKGADWNKALIYAVDAVTSLADTSNDADTSFETAAVIM